MGEAGDNRWDGWMASLTRWMSLSKLPELVMDWEAWHAVCSLWGCKESDMTEWRNWTELNGKLSWKKDVEYIRQANILELVRMGILNMGTRIRLQYKEGQLFSVKQVYLTYMQSKSWEMLGYMKHKLESRLLGELKRRTKEPLDESERGEWKRWLKTQHSKN